MREPLVKIEDASLFIPGDASRQLVLQNIDWHVDKNSHWALLGPNGSGKSTLLRLLHGDLWATSGLVAWRSENGWEKSPIAGKALTELVSPQIQENCQRQAWNVTVADMLLSGMAQMPLSFAAPGRENISSAKNVASLMENLDALAWLDLRLPELSQGQLRLVLLARALLRGPRLLLLDECADGLDESRKHLFFRELERRSNSLAIIFAAHRPDSIPDWCKERRYLRSGKLYLKEPAAPAKKNNQPALLPAQVQTSGNSGAACHADRKGTRPETLFSLENVTVYIESKPVLHNISWRMNWGEHWRIAGSNGSGKSTLLRLLAGNEFVAHGGKMTIWSPKLGRAVASLDELRQSVCLVSDLGQALYGYPLTGLELVCSGFDNSIGLYRKFSREEVECALEMMFNFFGENEARVLAKQSIRRMSSGQVRRLHLARALMCRPDVLLLDEPCTGLDWQTRSAYLALLDRLAAGEYAGYAPHLVFVSHYDEDCPSCVKHEATMENGRLLEARPRS